MSMRDAMQWYNSDAGNDGARDGTHYISPIDAKNSVLDTMRTCAGFIKIGDGSDGLLGHMYVPDASTAPAHLDTSKTYAGWVASASTRYWDDLPSDDWPLPFSGTSPAGWSDLGEVITPLNPASDTLRDDVTALTTTLNDVAARTAHIEDAALQSLPLVLLPVYTDGHGYAYVMCPETLSSATALLVLTTSALAHVPGLAPAADWGEVYTPTSEATCYYGSALSEIYGPSNRSVTGGEIALWGAEGVLLTVSTMAGSSPTIKRLKIVNVVNPPTGSTLSLGALANVSRAADSAPLDTYLRKTTYGWEPVRDRLSNLLPREYDTSLLRGAAGEWEAPADSGVISAIPEVGPGPRSVGCLIFTVSASAPPNATIRTKPVLLPRGAVCTAVCELQDRSSGSGSAWKMELESGSSRTTATVVASTETNWTRYRASCVVNGPVSIVITRTGTVGPADALAFSRAGLWEGVGGTWAPAGDGVVGRSPSDPVVTTTGTTVVPHCDVMLCLSPSTYTLPPIGTHSAHIRVVNDSGGAVTVLASASDRFNGGGANLRLPGRGSAELIGVSGAWTVVNGTSYGSNLGERIWEWSNSKRDWILVYADTGWVPVTTWDAAGAVTGFALGPGCAPRQGLAGGLWLRRVDDDVLLRYVNAAVTPGTAGSGTQTLWTSPLPTGWRMRSWASVPLRVGESAANSCYIYASNGRTISPIVTASASTTQNLPDDGEPARWSTPDQWPTSLIIS